MSNIGYEVELKIPKNFHKFPVYIDKEKQHIFYVTRGGRPGSVLYYIIGAKIDSDGSTKIIGAVSKRSYGVEKDYWKRKAEAQKALDVFAEENGMEVFGYGVRA